MPDVLFVTAIVAGVSMLSPTPLTYDECTKIAQTLASLPSSSAMYVQQEPDCGKGTENKCLGRADDAEGGALIVPKPKATVQHRRHAAVHHRRHYS